MKIPQDIVTSLYTVHPAPRGLYKISLNLWALKETADSICIPLSILYSRSLDTGVLPDGWKKGHVTPVYKKGGRSCPNNYRPITRTSVVGQ